MRTTADFTARSFGVQHRDKQLTCIFIAEHNRLNVLYTHTFTTILQNLANDAGDGNNDTKRSLSQFEVNKAVNRTAHFLWDYYGYVLVWVQMLANYQDDQFFFPMAIRGV